jgi:hypothetical protein
VAREAARQARAEWDREFLIQEDPDRPPISAEAISNRMLRPLFMILRHSSCFIFPSQEAFEDAIRLATCFQLLLQSINNAGSCYQLLPSPVLLECYIWDCGRTSHMVDYGSVQISGSITAHWPWGSEIRCPNGCTKHTRYSGLLVPL